MTRLVGESLAAVAERVILQSVRVLCYLTEDDPLVGRKFRTIEDDPEVTDEHGVVIHPAGSVFTIRAKDMRTEQYLALWEPHFAIQLATGERITTASLCTLWTADELEMLAQEVPDGDRG